MTTPVDGPSIPPPAGVESNFDNPPNGNALGHAAIGICVVVPFTCFFLRAYTLFKARKALLQDWLALVGLCLHVGFIYGAYRIILGKGILIHQWNYRKSEVPEYLYAVYVASNFGICTLFLIRSAILLEWARIFSPTSRNGFFWACHIVLWSQTLGNLILLFVWVFGCSPVEKIWNRAVPGKCLDLRAVDVALSAINLAADVVIFFLPQKVIWSLNMQPRTKLGVSAIFLIGISACVATGFRLGASANFYSSLDMTYEFARVFLWWTMEVTCVIGVFCLPNVPKAFEQLGILPVLSSIATWMTQSVRKARSSGSGRTEDASWPLDSTQDATWTRKYRQIEGPDGPSNTSA